MPHEAWTLALSPVYPQEPGDRGDGRGACPCGGSCMSRELRERSEPRALARARAHAHTQHEWSDPSALIAT